MTDTHVTSVEPLVDDDGEGWVVMCSCVPGKPLGLSDGRPFKYRKRRVANTAAFIHRLLNGKLDDRYASATHDD